jgi:hypothetical protein
MCGVKGWAAFSYTYDEEKDSLTVKYVKEASEDQNYFNNNFGSLKSELVSMYVNVSTLCLVGDFVGSTSDKVCELASALARSEGINLDLRNTKFTSSYSLSVTEGTYTSFDGTVYPTNTYTFSIQCDLNLNNAQSVIKGLTFPESENFKAIPADFFRNGSKLESLTFPDYIEVIGQGAFHSRTSIKNVRFPVMLKYLAPQCFQYCSGIQNVNLSMCTSLVAICYEAFERCGGLKKVLFPEGDTFKEMQNDVFYDCKLLDVVNMKVCKGLEAIQAWTFADCKLTDFQFPPNIVSIDKYAFYQSGLVNANMSYCHKLHSVESFSFAECTSLNFVNFCSHPKTIYGSVGSGAFYNSKNIRTVKVTYCEGTDVTKCVCMNRAFDYDVTEGQTDGSEYSVEQCAQLVFDYNGLASEPYTSATDFFVGNYKLTKVITHENLLLYWRQIPEAGVVDGEGGEQYAGNGWLEFLNTGNEFVVPAGEFLRTYSRTAGTGPVLLPKEVHAYRALDYRSLAENAEGKTVRGWIVLKELVTTKDGETYSYVPEETGVVLWSPKLSEEDGILVLPGYEGDDVTFKKYPNTGHDFVTEDPDNSTNVNMLMGSFGTGEEMAAPVWPWNFEEDIYELPKQFRNFGLTTAIKDGEDVYIWRRLMPGVLRSNRAYAQLPVERFTNNDENTSEMPDLDREDNGMFIDGSSGIGYIFDGEQDGITNVRETSSDSDAWYTLQGVKVQKPQKGIYIHNKQKVVVNE